jgi:uncharacterized protein (TIGR03067 family)
MLTRSSLAIAGVLLAIFAFPAFADDANDKEAKNLDGTWRFLSLKSDGEEAPKDVIDSWRWVIKDKTLTIAGEGKSSLEIDPSQLPKALNVTSLEGRSKGKKLQCIYKLEEKRLTICFPEGKQASQDKSRPKEFEGGQGKSLVVLERIKPD